MCGIIHCKRLDGKLANRIIAKRFEKQRSRGTEGFGFIEINNGIVGREVRACTEKDIKAKLLLSEATEIMFHHRTPTSTPNFVEATHPILVSNKYLKYDYYVMHNGIISNDDDLRDKHLVAGFAYTTEIIKKFVTKGEVYKSMMYNDSEALAIDFAMALENEREMEATGSIAMVALQFEKKSRKAVALYFGRNIGNPLKIEESKDFLGISSETGAILSSDVLFRLDYKTNAITERKCKIGKYITSYQGSGWSGYNGYTGQQDLDFDGYPRKQISYAPPEDEADFDIELYEAKTMLEDEQRQAYASGDYDRATEIQIEIDEIDIELGGDDDDDIEWEEGDIEKLGVGYHINKANEVKEF